MKVWWINIKKQGRVKKLTMKIPSIYLSNLRFFFFFFFFLDKAKGFSPELYSHTTWISFLRPRRREPKKKTKFPTSQNSTKSRSTFTWESKTLEERKGRKKSSSFQNQRSMDGTSRQERRQEEEAAFRSIISIFLNLISSTAKA